MNSSNEHVVALGSDTFLSEADCSSHLVCLQDETKHTYHSQVLSDFAFQVDIIFAEFVLLRCCIFFALSQP